MQKIDETLFSKINHKKLVLTNTAHKMASFLFNIFLISFTGTVISMTDSKDLWGGQFEKLIFRKHWCTRPGFCELCKKWSEDPNRTARLWYQRDGIASIRASIVSV